MRDNLRVRKQVRFGPVGFLCLPFAQGQFPYVAGANGIFPVLIKKPPQFQEDGIAVRISAPAFPEKPHRLILPVQLRPEPKRCDDVSFHSMRVQFRGKPQPRQQLFRLLRPIKMNMLRNIEVPAKAIDPIFRLTEEIHLPRMFLLMLVPIGHLVLFRALLHMRRFERLHGIENGWVISPVKIGIGLDKKEIGQKAPPVAQHDFQHIAGLSAAAGPLLFARLQIGGQAKADRQEKRQNQVRRGRHRSFRVEFCDGITGTRRSGKPLCKLRRTAWPGPPPTKESARRYERSNRAHRKVQGAAGDNKARR